MSEEQLLSRIEARAKADCESILDRANKDAERIRGAAQQKAEITKRRKTADARHRWLAERRLIEGQGVLDACRLLTQTRGEAIAKVRESVFSDLAQWLEKPLYENALKELLLECVEAISVDANVQPVKILCSERDKRRFQGLLKKHNVPYEMEIDDHILGGLVMVDSKGETFVDARLRPRLEEVWEASLPEIGRILFEERPGEEKEEEEEETPRDQAQPPESSSSDSDETEQDRGQT